ncbi:acyl-CoA-binding domain-containing protein 6 [Cimex lectularius]|uniref:Acyl-CoA-binding domain-containing protein 6 n=1 Tax=Cimex lectularius TaxID=79782 RepID=A0A8I6S863_CIMLE|nr:acyl-CoA-binding domain-containing protein 6 [Cimex lectularius]
MDVEKDDLTLKFNTAADFLPSLVPSLKPEKLLQFYGLYKQSTVGKCNTTKPNWYALEAKQKWNAWNSLGNMSQEDAMKNYISLMTEIAPDWESTKHAPSSWVSVSRMRDSDSDLDDSDKDVFDYVKEGCIEKVRMMDSKEINMLDEDGIGLIHWAADRGNSEMVKCLLELGADIDLRDSTGQTALHYACACGHKDVVNLLLKRNADVNITCKEGFLPIDIADEDEIRSCIESSKCS